MLEPFLPTDITCGMPTGDGEGVSATLFVIADFTERTCVVKLIRHVVLYMETGLGFYFLLLLEWTKKMLTLLGWQLRSAWFQLLHLLRTWQICYAKNQEKRKNKEKSRLRKLYHLRCGQNQRKRCQKMRMVSERRRGSSKCYRIHLHS